MKHVAAQTIVRPKDLSAEDKARFADALYAVHSRIFDGVSREAFVAYVVDSKAEETVILVHEGEDGAMVGYCALHFFEKHLGGEPITILRSEMGMIGDYRGGSANEIFFMKQVLRRALKNRGRRLCIMGTLVHPSTYTLLARYADRIFPSAERKTPSDVASLIRELARSFELETVDAANPFVVRVGWKSRETSLDLRYRSTPHIRGAARFFLEQNPGYEMGHGLLTLVPVSLGCVARGALRFARGIAEKRVKALTAWAAQAFSRVLPQRTAEQPR